MSMYILEYLHNFVININNVYIDLNNIKTYNIAMYKL